MLRAIFYARFDLEKGPSIIHQSPSSSLIPADADASSILPNFNDISAYVIPDYEFCNKPLSITVKSHRVIGYPVSVEDPKYERNRFTFNVCFVLHEDADPHPWAQIVRKTAIFFRGLEEENGLLDAEEQLDGLIWAGESGYPAPNVGFIYPLLNSMLDQINSYGETCVRVNDLHVLNLRLERPQATPPEVHAWHVPLLVKEPPSPEQWTWDLTLAKIYPHVDGIKHVRRIAELADVELQLVKRAVRELVYHERAILLDLFHFQAIYTTTGDFTWFVRDIVLQEECRRYVSIDASTNGLAVVGHKPTEPNGLASRETILALYASIIPGQNMQEFLITHQAELSNIDIRRFITFGVIKGFLRRIHKFVLAAQANPSTSNSHSGNGSASTTFNSGGAYSPTKIVRPRTDDDAARDIDRAWRKAALSSGWATPPGAKQYGGNGSTGTSHVTGASSLSKSARSNDGSDAALWDEKLRPYLDGMHCLDEICSATHTSERKIMERLKGGRLGEIVLFNQ